MGPGRAWRHGAVVGPSFFSGTVLTVRTGLAYKPPIDAAPRFDRPGSASLKLLSHLLVHDASGLRVGRRVSVAL